MKYLLWENRKAKGLVELDTLGEDAGERLRRNLIENECKIRVYEEPEIVDIVFNQGTDLEIDDAGIRRRIIIALELSGWCQKKAAKRLNIPPKAIWDRIQKFGIESPYGSWHRGKKKSKPLKLIRGIT